MLELIKHRMISNHQVGKKFQRHIALQFFVAREPDNPHPASSENLHQRMAAKDLLSTAELTRCHRCDTARVLVSHLDKISIIKMKRKVKARALRPRTSYLNPADRVSDLPVVAKIVTKRFAAKRFLSARFTSPSSSTTETSFGSAATVAVPEKSIAVLPFENLSDAFEQLTIAASFPGHLSYGQLRLPPYWEQLRGDPRFEKIVASL